MVRLSLFPYPASPAAVQDLEPALVEAGCKDTIHTYVAEAIVNGIEPSWHKLCNELQKHVSVGAIAAAYDALTAYFAYSVDLFDTHAALQRALPALLSAWRNAMEGARDPTEIMLAQIIHVIGGRASADTHLPAGCRLRDGLVLLGDGGATDTAHFEQSHGLAPPPAHATAVCFDKGDLGGHVVGGGGGDRSGA